MIPFTLDGYAELLARLQVVYRLKPSRDIETTSAHERTVFLRHDVDAHLEGALELADVEEAHGVRSTWYIATRLHYNPGYEPNAAIIRELAKRGHSIGLHYLPGQMSLVGDVGLLSRIAERPVISWVMHQPSSGGVDHHRERAFNPHSRRMHYVSDSRMRWVDDYLPALLRGEPHRAMLNTHHEHWISHNSRAGRRYAIPLHMAEAARQAGRAIVDAWGWDDAPTG